MSDTLLIVRPDRSHGYDLGDGHPMNPAPRDLAVELARAYGLLDRPGVSEVQATRATDAQIGAVHAPALVSAISRYSAEPRMAASPESATWGVHPAGDTPAFAGMHEAAAAICGAACAAAAAVLEGRARRAFVPEGGLHHAMANRSAGFCVYNDPAVAIQSLLDAGCERVAYIDVDVHHGDGVQWIFYEDPRVLTCSVHESGRTLFPGTGGLAERGAGPGAGTSVNIPLPAWSGTEPYLQAIREVIVPAVARFRPDVLVTQNGVDAHHQDPLAHLQVRLAAFPEVWTLLRDLAEETAGGRWVALGGGGYNPDVLPRAWAMLQGVLADVPDLDDALPAGWLRQAEERLGRPLTPTLRGDTEPEAAADARAAADAEALVAVANAKLLAEAA